MVGSQSLVGVPGLWTAALRRGHEPRSGRATSARHRPCVLPPGGLPMLVHRPAPDRARIQVHQPRQLQPALSRPSIRDLAGPPGLGSCHVNLPRPQRRGDRLAGSAVRGHGPASPGTWHGPPSCSSTAAPSCGPRDTLHPGGVGPGDDDHHGAALPRPSPCHGRRRRPPRPRLTPWWVAAGPHQPHGA